jgi:hypothetical protein
LAVIRGWFTLVTIAAFGSAPALAQDPVTPRLPFMQPPDQLPGAPRAMGELPEGLNQPPSTLPGNGPGTPPRAMGEAPPISPFYPLFPSLSTGTDSGGTSILSPWAALGGAPARSAGLPLFLGGIGPRGDQSPLP